METCQLSVEMLPYKCVSQTCHKPESWAQTRIKKQKGEARRTF